MKQNLKDKKIIYTFDTWEDYYDLMQYLEDEGVAWNSGRKPTESQEPTDTYDNADLIAVRLEKGVLTYELKDWYPKYLPSYRDCVKVHWGKIEQ